MYVVAARLVAPRIGAALRVSPPGQWLLEGAQFAYFLGVPYLALLTGAFAPSDVGLQGSPALDLLLGWAAEEWMRALGQAIALGLLTLLVVRLLTWQIRRAGGCGAAAMEIVDASAAHSIRDGIYAEVHWSFYRALPMVLWGDAGRAALLGIALAAAEALLAGRRTTSSVSRISASSALLGMGSATFFALTGGNFWIASVLQVTMRVSLARIAPAPERAEPLEDVIV
ncbi:MAG TPA: hypothetical protein VFL17_15330 [Anaerolineae bacterium]|nr:hypothetical protein [Anaerolineae bacterium]